MALGGIVVVGRHMSEATEKPEDKSVQDAGPEHFPTYIQYNRMLRTWFVAFGVGGPALFLVHEPLRTRLVAQGAAASVAACFLLGAGAQVLIALFNKIVNWGIYYGDLDESFRSSWRYKAIRWLASQIWIDVLSDLITIVAFAVGIWLVYLAFGV